MKKYYTNGKESRGARKQEKLMESKKGIVGKQFRENKSFFFAKQKDAMDVCEDQQYFILLTFKLALFSNSNPSFPSLIDYLLQQFGDEFQKELIDALPPIRVIEHQIDLIPGVPLPYKPAHRTNSNDTKGIQKQERTCLNEVILVKE